MRGHRVRFIVQLVMAVAAALGILSAVLLKHAPTRSARPVSPKPGSSLEQPSDLSIDGGGPEVARLIEEKYAIQVIKDQEYPVRTYHGLILATNAEASQLDRYFSTFGQEFLIYPPSLFRQSRLKRIVLCRGLSFAGQGRAAVPDYEHDALYYDVVSGDYSRVYQRHAIHHEFFHVIDYKDDGEVYSDARWARLNPETFRYRARRGEDAGRPLQRPAQGDPRVSDGLCNFRCRRG